MADTCHLTSMRSIRLLSWNLLHGHGHGADADDVAQLIEEHDPDLMLMQKAGPRLDALKTRFGGNYERCLMGRRSHGPAVWSRHAFENLTGCGNSASQNGFETIQ